MVVDGDIEGNRWDDGEERRNGIGEFEDERKVFEDLVG